MGWNCSPFSPDRLTETGYPSNLDAEQAQDVREDVLADVGHQYPFWGFKGNSRKQRPICWFPHLKIRSLQTTTPKGS